jgi:hypothetical protein
MSNLRILAFLRRGIVALESIAESQETMARLAQGTWDEAHFKRKGKPTEISVFDPVAASDRWERRLRGEGDISE